MQLIYRALVLLACWPVLAGAAPVEAFMATSPATYTDFITARVGRVYRWVWIGYASHATGTVTITAQPYTAFNTTVGSPLTLYTGTPAVGKNTWAGNSPPMPATTTQVILLAQYTNATTGRTLDLSVPSWEEAPDIEETEFVLVDSAGTERLRMEYNPATNTASITAPASPDEDALAIATEHGLITWGLDGYITISPENGVIVDNGGTVDALAGFLFNGTPGATGTGGGGDTVEGGIITALGAGGGGPDVSARHLTGTGNAPGAVAGPAAGDGFPFAGIQGTDLAGLLSVATDGTTAASDIVATITFDVPLANPPMAILLTPANEAAAKLYERRAVWADPTEATATEWVLRVGQIALVSSTTYLWSYLIIGQ